VKSWGWAAGGEKVYTRAPDLLQGDRPAGELGVHVRRGVGEEPKRRKQSSVFHQTGPLKAAGKVAGHRRVGMNACARPG